MGVCNRIVAAIFGLLLLSASAWAGTDTISGTVQNIDGSPCPNCTVTFNSQVVQISGGVTYQPLLSSTQTDGNGVMTPIALPQGLVVQITISENGATFPPYGAIVPFLTTSTFDQMNQGITTDPLNVLASQQPPTGPLSMNNQGITNLACPANPFDALAWGCDATIHNLTVTGTSTIATTGTQNFNGYSGTNVGSILTANLEPPQPITGTATCSSSCVTSYLYQLTCVSDTGAESEASPPFTMVNNATLSSSNFNAITWPTNSQCYGGYNVYRNSALVANVAVASNSYSDQGAAASGAPPPQAMIGLIPAISGGTGFQSTLEVPGCTIYADPAGTGSACTQAAPCTLTQALVNVAGTSGVVCLNDGGSQSSYPYVSGNATINLPAGGTPQNPAWIRPTNLVTVIGPNNTINTPKVKISAQGGTTKIGLYPAASGIASNWVIYGLEFDGSAGTTSDAGIEFGGTNAGGSSHLWILNNLVHDWGGGGISFTQDDYKTVVGNVVYNTSSRATVCTSAISDYEPLASDHLLGWHNLFAGNIMHDTTQPGGHGCVDGEGIILDDYNHSQTNNVPYAFDTLVENNVAYNNQGDGIEVFDHGYGTALIRNNSTYHNFVSSSTVTTGCSGEIIASSSSGVIAANNIVWPSATGNAGNDVGFGVCSSSGGLAVAGNTCNTDSGAQNCWFDTSPDPNPSQANQFNVNPLFVGATNLDILPTSPAIRSGVSKYGQSLVDLLGFQRTPGQYDAGAYVSATPPLLKPVPKVSTEIDEPVFTGTFNTFLTTNLGEQLNGGANMVGTTGMFPIGTPVAPVIASGFSAGTTDYYYCIAEDMDGVLTLPSAGTGTTGTSGSVWCGPQAGAAAYFLLRNNTGTPPTGTVSVQIGGATPTVAGGPVQMFDTGLSPTSITVPTVDLTGQLVFRGRTSGAAAITAQPVAGFIHALQLPNTDGASGNPLQTDGLGLLSWNAFKLPASDGSSGFGLITNGSHQGSFANIIGSNGTTTSLTIGALSGNTTVASKALTTPATGGPYRAIVSYAIPVTQTSAAGSVECSVSDGTNNFADLMQSIPTTPNANSAVLARSDVSTTAAYAANTSVTFTLKCQNAAGTSTVTGTSATQGIQGFLQVEYVPSN